LLGAPPHAVPRHVSTPHCNVSGHCVRSKVYCSKPQPPTAGKCKKWAKYPRNLM